MFSAETDVNDFKEVTRYRLTGNGVFEKVGPDGELKHAGLRGLAGVDLMQVIEGSVGLFIGSARLRKEKEASFNKGLKEGRTLADGGGAAA